MTTRPAEPGRLRTRKPTGRPAWPLVLVEGAEKSGKSWLTAELAASPRIGRTVWFDLGEGSSDEYLDPDDPRHEVVEHDGSYGALLSAVAAAREAAAKALANGERPMLFVLDTGTAEWELLSTIADQRARVRRARQLKRDISADETVTIGVDLWNEANAKHRRLMTLLMTFPGVVVVTARGKDVAQIGADGKPVEGRRDYKVEGHKTLAYDASVWVRLSRDEAPLVVGVRSKRVGIRPGVDRPRPVPDLTLEHLLFTVLGLDADRAEVRDLVTPQVTDADLADPPSERVRVLEFAIDSAPTKKELRAVYAQISSALAMEAFSEEDAARLRARAEKRAETLPDDEPEQPTLPATTDIPPTDNQRRKIYALFRKLGITGADQHDFFTAVVSEGLAQPRVIASFNDLTTDDAYSVILKLEQREREAAKESANATT